MTVNTVANCAFIATLSAGLAAETEWPHAKAAKDAKEVAASEDIGHLPSSLLASRSFASFTTFA